jgi:carboxymethylenebutenolidase
MDHPVTTQWIAIAPGFAGYLALPPGGSGPGLLLFQEIFGVNHHIRTVAEQYALDGFVVLAPDVFWRQAPRVELGYVGDDRARGMALAQALQPAQVMADIAAAHAALCARPEAAGRKLGALGYCMGGRLAWTAAASTDIAAAVPFYGGGIHNQLDLAPRVRCPLQFHYAGHDDHIPPSAVDSVRQALAGHDAQVHVYADAQHGFNCWARATYHAPSAALSHGRATTFLAAHLF